MKIGDLFKTKFYYLNMNPGDIILILELKKAKNGNFVKFIHLKTMKFSCYFWEMEKHFEKIEQRQYFKGKK